MKTLQNLIQSAGSMENIDRRSSRLFGSIRRLVSLYQESATDQSVPSASIAARWKDECGEGLCAEALATVVGLHDWDQRFSRENRVWAKNSPYGWNRDAARELRIHYPDAVHPAHMDAICTAFRKMCVA